MKRRNPLAVFLLSLITLGIYDIYWLVVTKKELNAKTRIKVPTIWLLFGPVILLIIVAIALFAMQGSGSSSQPGVAIVSLIIDLLAFILIVPLSFYWFFKFSKAVNEYTNGKMSTGVTFLLMWILHLIGVAIVQDAFNDMLEAGTAPAAPVAGGASGGPQPGLMSTPPAPETAAVPPQPSMVVPQDPIAAQPAPMPAAPSPEVAPQAPTVVAPEPSSSPVAPEQADGSEPPAVPPAETPTVG